MIPEKLTHLTCSHIGLSFLTDLWGHRRDDGLYEMRRGYCLFGFVQSWKSLNANPFSADFEDNYVSGVGPSPADAWQALDKEVVEVLKLRDV